MSANSNADDQFHGQSEIVEDKDLSPAKALFRGQIIQSAFWPFPQIEAQQRELLDMVVESVDRFLADQQDEFESWDRSGEQPPVSIGDVAHRCHLDHSGPVLGALRTLFDFGGEQIGKRLR